MNFGQNLTGEFLRRYGQHLTPSGAGQAETPDFSGGAQMDNQAAQAQYNAREQQKAGMVSAGIAVASTVAALAVA